MCPTPIVFRKDGASISDKHGENIQELSNFIRELKISHAVQGNLTIYLRYFYDMEYYTIIKSLHIIFVVTWFAGLFYMFRLFVYHAEAARTEEPRRSILMEQYTIMERRLWYAITWPSCILTLIFGIWLLVLNPGFLTQPWMHIKLTFVAGLLVYQLYGQRVLKGIREHPLSYTSVGMRMMNEVPTVILIAVVFLVVMKSSFSWIWGTLGILGTGVLLMVVVKMLRAKG